MGAIDDKKINMRNAIQFITESLDEKDAFFLINIDDIILKYEEFHKILPQVMPFYAVKCNDSIVILKVLVALDIGFDCSTKNEIQTMLSLGVSPNRIIYSQPIKQESHLQYSTTVGVNMMTFDCIPELHKIKEICPSAKLVIRISFDDQTTQYNFGGKYGCDAESEAFEILNVAHTLNLNVIGVSFHVGSSCHNYNTYKYAIEASKKVFELGKSLGFNMTVLDIGGGFPGNTLQEFYKIGTVINDALDTFFSGENVQVLAEPGRYFVESAANVACRIISRKKRNDNFLYYLNDGRCGSFAFLNYAYEPMDLKILKDKSDMELYSSIVYGPTCWGGDIIHDSIHLPQLQINDWLYFENFGAYKQVLSSTFNGYPRTKFYAICTSKKWNLLESEFSIFKYTSEISIFKYTGDVNHQLS